MRFTLIIFSFLIANYSFAQNLTATATPSTICSNGSSDLSVNANALTSPIVISDPNTPMGDDEYSAVIPIGFNFDFYGNTFTDCIVSSNGYITFDLTNAGGYSSWVTNTIPQGFPGATGPAVNAIFGPWVDIDANGNAFAAPPVPAGYVECQTIGVAPNRIFIVKWYEQPLYGTTCNQFCTALTIQLFETSNKIENHISDLTSCIDWNGGLATHGIQNGTGTIAHIVIDPISGLARNNIPFQAAGPEGWEYIPDPANPNNYTINQIPFSPTTGSGSIVWTESLSGTVVGNGQTITVSPTVTTDYTVTISPNCAGGTSSTASVTVFVSDLTLNSTTTDVLCNGDADGSITITPVGTAPPWNFDWQDSNGNTVQTDNNVNGPITLNGISGDTYTILVTDDLGCSQQETVTINEPTAIICSIDNYQDLSCFQSNNGTINSSASGGSPLNGNYSFSWTGPNGFSSNNANIQGLEPGLYTVTATDNNGCSDDISQNISMPDELIITLDNYVDVTCFGFSDGAINTTISGGTPIYNINWTGPNGYTSNSADISGITDGNYNLSVLDNNNCPATLNVTIGQAGIVVSSFDLSSYSTFNISCNGYNDGIINSNTTGGSPPYNYNWSGPNSFTSTDEDIFNLYAGVYNVDVTDANGCTTPNQITLNEPTPLVSVLQNHSDISCYYESDGFIETSAFGSIDNTYSYSWEGPNLFFSNQADIYNLSDEGLYTLTVTDANQCISTVDYDLQKPEELVAIIYNLNDTITDNYSYINFWDRSLGEPIMWTWSFTDGSPEVYSQNHTHYFSSIGDFTVELKIEDINGCIDSTTKLIKVIDEHTLYVPNAFTPDLDGKNDVFTIYHHGLREETWRFEVYDRFGSLIYASENPNESWDGTNKFSNQKIMTGVYTYYLSYQDWDGWIYDHTNCEICSGTITLIR